MKPASLLIPYERLPEGYARSLADPPDPPVEPKPAATLVLLREGSGSIEVLLLKRSDRTRFIPGAFVFPGGRVDEADSSPDVLPVLSGPSHPEADALLGIAGREGSGLAYWIAALRETFEEAGILVERGGKGARSVPLDGRKGEGALRAGLHEGRTSFPRVLEAMGAILDGGRVAYIGHWQTPAQEHFRYDTRFFGVEVPAGCRAFPDGVEMVEALWMTPTEALNRNCAGGFPMVFPTLMTLQALEPYRSPRKALEALAKGPIAGILPHVEALEHGVRMVEERAEAL
jgi:8-oxo-dGTP pyrophosphatase MutT (NUDIX family)